MHWLVVETVYTASTIDKESLNDLLRATRHLHCEARGFGQLGWMGFVEGGGQGRGQLHGGEEAGLSRELSPVTKVTDP